VFNPFSPTDIERDYKIGDDMAFLQFSGGREVDIQMLYVPRRNVTTGEVEWEESSLAGKLHFALGTTEFDLMAAHHFDDVVIGMGGTGYLGDAAWRLDATWTFADKDRADDDFLSLIANMDYSWVWWGKNFYGFVEFFFSGLGRSEYGEALANPHLRERLDRGNLFVLGRSYLNGHIQIEIHPLFNLHFTAINNVKDPSGIFQPRAAWDVFQDLRITIGSNRYYGGNGTEFGGFRLPGTQFVNKPQDNAFLCLTYYF